MRRIIAVLLASTGFAANAGEPPHPAHHEAPAKPAHNEPKPKGEKPGAEKPAQRVEILTPAIPRKSVESREAGHASHAPERQENSQAPGKAPTQSRSSADEAIAMLREGNERWVKDSGKNPNTDPARRSAVAEQGQTPFATIITCADSRLPVERIFDRGVGELFVVRVAGNVAGQSETGTVEYGVGHLHTPLIVVLGHTKCGAVAAAASGAEVHGNLAGLISRITPAVDRARRLAPGADDATLVSAAIRENVWQTVFDLLKSSGELRDAASEGKVQIVGAVCDISTGKVEFLGSHPWQSELLTALNTTGAAQATAKDGPTGHE